MNPSQDPNDGPIDPTKTYGALESSVEVPTTLPLDGSEPKTTAFDEPNSKSQPDAPKIDGYRIISEIARGGMGRVYSAVDLRLDRRVAIKTLLPHAQPERFVNESRITACLPHPGIPPVHAIGSLNDGSPYLVMKLVEGQTLDQLLRARSSPSQELAGFIEIFQQIAQALGFAHSQSIIHRDIKPINVMVGAFGEVQVMDWGLAKRLETSESNASLQASATLSPHETAHGTVLGTPGYIAPEQARGEAVDARADVFSLGATLAMILTGKPAFVESTGIQALLKASRGDVFEVMQRLDQANVDIELVDLAKRCLAPSSSDRPANAQQVAELISNHRKGVEKRLRAAELEASEARVREIENQKRRNVWQALIAVLITGLLASVSLAIWANEARRAERNSREHAQQQQQRAERGEDLAERRLEQVEVEKRNTERQRNIAEAVRYFLERRLFAMASSVDQADFLMLLGESPTDASFNPTILELLELAKLELAPDQIETSFPDQPELQTELLRTVGWAFQSVGEPEQAIPLLTRSLDLLRKRTGEEDLEVLKIRNELALAYRSLGQFKRAEEEFTLLLEAKLRLFGEANSSTLITMHNLALTKSDLGDYQVALELLERAFEIESDHAVSSLQTRLTLIENIALTHLDLENYEEARDRLHEVLVLRSEKLGADHPSVFRTINNLARTYLELEDFDRAEELYQQAISGQIEKFGPDNPSTMAATGNLAALEIKRADWARAKSRLESLLSQQTEVIGREHPNTLTTLNNLAYTYAELGQYSDAIRILREVLELRRERLGESHPETLIACGNLGWAMERQSPSEESLKLLEQSCSIRTNDIETESLVTLSNLANLSNAYQNRRRYSDALEILEFVCQARAHQLGEKSLDTLTAQVNLARCLIDLGQDGEALLILERAKEPMQSVLGRDHVKVQTTLSILSVVYHRNGYYEKALSAMQEVAESRERTLGLAHPSTLTSFNNLGRMYEDQNDLPNSMAYFKRVAEGVTKAELSDEVRETLIGNAIRVHELAGDWQSAEQWRRAEIERIETKSGIQSLPYIQALSSLSFNLRTQGKWSEAEEVTQKLLTALQSATPDDWQVELVRLLLAESILKQERVSEAEPLMLQAHQALTEYAQNHPKEFEEQARMQQAIQDSRRFLREIYISLERPKEAAKYQEDEDEAQ